MDTGFPSDDAPSKISITESGQIDQLSKEQVAKWSKALGGWEKMINRAGYTWRDLSTSETENLTQAKAMSLALKNPSLIRARSSSTGTARSPLTSPTR